MSPRPADSIKYFLVDVPDSVLLKQIALRMNNPALIDQGYTNLCGMAACAMVLVRYEPESYKKLMIDLAENGRADYNRYTLKLKKRIAAIEKNFYAEAAMPVSDWILLASMRNKCNFLFPYGGNMPKWYEKLAGSNFPADLRRTLRLMGFKKSKDNMNGFWPIRKPALTSLNQLQSAFNEKKTPIILLNTKMYKSGKFSLLSNHFAIYNGQLKIDETTQTVEFNIWTFGYDAGKTIQCSFEAFRQNYFGCIIVEEPRQ